jgi:hypothetical protein
MTRRPCDFELAYIKQFLDQVASLPNSLSRDAIIDLKYSARMKSMLIDIPLAVLAAKEQQPPDASPSAEPSPPADP